MENIIKHVVEKDGVKITVIIEGEIPNNFNLEEHIFDKKGSGKIEYTSNHLSEIYDRCLREADEEDNSFYKQNRQYLFDSYGQYSPSMERLKSLHDWNRIKADLAAEDEICKQNGCNCPCHNKL